MKMFENTCERGFDNHVRGFPLHMEVRVDCILGNLIVVVLLQVRPMLRISKLCSQIIMMLCRLK